MSSRTIMALSLMVAILLATLALSVELGPDWGRYAPATCLATHCFCEAPRNGSPVLQPSNSWSSFAFVLIGVWMAFSGSNRENDGQSAFSGLPAAWFGITAIIIGVGSFLLHASLTLWGQFLDVLGMYLTSAFLISYAVFRWRATRGATAIGLYIVLCAALITVLVVQPETRRWLFAVVLVVALYLEIGLARPLRPRVEFRLLLIGIALQALAFAIWILDQQGIWCQGTSLIQGHAVWHLLNAAALYFNFLYYRSERAPS